MNDPFSQVQQAASILWDLYSECLKQGFTEQQAFALVHASMSGRRG